MPNSFPSDDIVGAAPVPGLNPKTELPDNPDILKVMAVLGEQNVIRDRTYEKIFTKLEAASKDAKSAAAKADKLEPLVTRIDITTQATNGKVKVLRGEMDQVLPDSKTLMGERKQKILEEETARLRREGLLVLPRTIGAGLKIVYKYGIKIVTAIGAVTIAWPVLKWLWDHRIFWGH